MSSDLSDAHVTSRRCRRSAGPARRAPTRRASIPRRTSRAFPRRLREVVGRRLVALRTCDGIAGLARRLDRLLEPERPGEREAEPREEARSPDVLSRHEVECHAQERRRVVVGVRRLRRLCGGERGATPRSHPTSRRSDGSGTRCRGALGAALFHRLRDTAVERTCRDGFSSA